MVYKLNVAAGHVRDFGPCRSHKLNGSVVVFGYAMRGDERVNGHDAELVFLDRRNDSINNWTRDGGSGPRLFGDDDFHLAPGVDEEPPFDFGRVDLVVKARGDDAPL
jgi:hypothetical protein